MTISHVKQYTSLRTNAMYVCNYTYKYAMQRMKQKTEINYYPFIYQHVFEFELTFVCNFELK